MLKLEMHRDLNEDISVSLKSKYGRVIVYQAKPEKQATKLI